MKNFIFFSNSAQDTGTKSGHQNKKDKEEKEKKGKCYNFLRKFLEFNPQGSDWELSFPKGFLRFWAFLVKIKKNKNSLTY